MAVKDKDTASEDPSKNTSQKVLTGVAYVGALGVGAYIADDAIKDSIYHQHKGEVQEIVDRRIQRTTDRLKAMKGLDSKDQPIKGTVAQELRTIEHGFEGDIKKIFADELHLKNRSDYWTALNRTNKMRVAERAFTNAGIALAVTLSLTNMSAISKLFTRVKKDEDKSQQHSR